MTLISLKEGQLSSRIVSFALWIASTKIQQLRSTQKSRNFISGGGWVFGFSSMKQDSNIILEIYLCQMMYFYPYYNLAWPKILTMVFSCMERQKWPFLAILAVFQAISNCRNFDYLNYLKIVPLALWTMECLYQESAKEVTHKGPFTY